ncbi:MAG: M20/M25/M40 family metallo-hydrolase, partial [bacterium]|nr:M20/M25/M40 family metallo-hydrolase [bacterium]
MKNRTRLNAPSARRILVPVIVLALCLCGVSAAKQETVWVTMERDVFTRLAATPAALPDTLPPTALGSQGGIVITRLPARAIEALSTFTHTTMGRIGGFIVHDTYAEAAAAVEAATRGTEKALPVDFQIDAQTLVNQLLPLLDKTEIYDTIDHLSTAYVNRYYQYTSGQQAALWIRDQWQGYATGRGDVTVSTYTHSFTQPSVVLTITGATLPSEIIVLGAHLDSTAGGMSPTTSAPGADDDASGVATLSEVIRVLMANVTPDRTVKFMAYAGEEGGLLGSGDIAQDHLDAGDNVVGMVQFDMTGYFGSVEDIILVNDYTTPELTTFLGDLIDEYQPSLLWAYTSCGYGCSDHASWTNRGYPAAFPVEAKYGEHNPNIHTANDTLASLGNSTDHALKFAQLALSFAVETGVADCSPAPVADAGSDRSINSGDSTTIGTPAQGGHTYSWSPGGATTAEVLVSPTATTVYTVTATTSCGSAQDAVTVTVLPPGQNGPQEAVYD